jgi:hypothetical protein
VLYTPEEASRAAEALLDAADGRRAEALDTLELVHRARARVLGRAVERLEAQEDPRAETLAAAVEATHDVARRLKVEAARARLEELEPAEEAAKVHGHVLDERLEPVAGANVHVVDERGKRIRGATASTNADGYFVLEWSPPRGREGEAEHAVRLRVTTGAARVLHEEPSPRPRAVGAVEYTEIVVPEEPA